MGSSKFRDWVEEHLPWYSPHNERLRNVKSELISRAATDATEQAQVIIDRDRAILAAYREADEKLRRR